MKNPGIALLFGLALLGSGTWTPAAAAPGTFVTTVQVTTGLPDGTAIANAGDGSGRLFIVQQTGQIRIWTGSQLLSTPFLNTSGTSTACTTGACGERGLLGLAFHPSYATNGFFYVYYTRNSDGAIQVARYHVSANPNVADSASALVLLTIPHPGQSNHNGGNLAFGPDGYLYLGTGDGGGGGDPDENGQNVNALLGKLLRIDVDGTAPPTPSPRPTRSPRPPPAPARTRSGPTACATPGASASTARPATSTSRTSGRATGRRSTSRPPAPRAARTTGGTAARGSTPTPTPTAT